MSDGSMTAPYANCKYHDPILIFWIQFISLINVYISLLRVVSLSIGGLSHMLTHSLPRCLSRTHALDITLPPSRNHLQLFPLTFITSTLPLANIHTHNPHRPFLYTWTCLRVSCTHIIFTPVSHALSHTSLPNRRV